MCMQCPKISFFFLIQSWRRPKDGEFFLVSKVCTLFHLMRMASPFDDLPCDVEVDVIDFLISKRDR